MAKMPAFQFYPGDWRKDPGVNALCRHDRSVWFDMLCIMHESEERGVLLLAGKPMPEVALAQILNLDNQTLNQTLTTLLTYGVASRRDEDGAIICRRMVRDEKLCQIRRTSGKLGGNPVLVNQTPNQTDNHDANQSPTPSSSSSSSIQKKPSRVKRESDSRFSEFKELLTRAWAVKNKEEMPWGPGEGSNLSSLLSASPNLKAESFRKMLHNRHQSKVNQSARPMTWIAKITEYANGPLDQFGKPLEAKNDPAAFKPITLAEKHERQMSQ